MAITNTWKITRVEVLNKDNLENVAIQVCFGISGADENDKRGFVQGDVLLGNPDPSKFTPIDQVTEDQVISWTKAALADRVVQFEKMIADQIASQYEEKPKDADLPWLKTEGKQPGESNKPANVDSVA